MRLRLCTTLLVATCAAPVFAAPTSPDAEHPPAKRTIHFKQGDPLVWRFPDPAQGDRKILEKNKYFHEPGDTDTLHHYDARYYKGVVTPEERAETLRHMIRAYLHFFHERGLETWIAHGTLLGWWWNGKMLPWDWDIDTQVAGETLEYLAKNFNHTIIPYSLMGASSREYLLDVNPMQWERDRGDGMNVIDARWIDTRNGLFIDITGLSETQPEAAPGIWSCKNYHHYRTKDLYPMRESTFEGMPAKIPYAYDKILLEEYHQKALVLTEYEGHFWDDDEREWIKKPTKTDHESEPKAGNTKHKRSDS